MNRAILTPDSDPSLMCTPRSSRLSLICWLLLLLVSCTTQQPVLRLATTTTTVDSGLMDAILPNFEAANDVRVDVVAVGTGEALALGRAGDVDIALVHARELEDEFVAEGYGVNRRDVMYNTFVLVGPASDPAGVSQTSDVVAAFRRLYDTQSTFISRGDGSGTHQREQTLWAAAGIAPAGEWYQSIGQGMGATLTLAAEQEAYTLSDTGTFYARGPQQLDLVILLDGDERLFNPYGVIAVNPELHPGIDAQLSEDFIQWLVSEDTQTAINQYRVDGRQLFFANVHN